MNRRFFMNTDIKTYAKQKGVSTQAVYKQIRNHEKELKGHIFKESGKKWLDEYAIDYLDRQSQQSAVAIQSLERDEAMEMLQNKYIEILESYKDLADQLANQKTLLLVAQSEKQEAEKQINSAENRAAEAERRSEQAEAELQQLRAELEAEKSRKLTWRERFRGRK